jgi:predicted ester cyclase
MRSNILAALLTTTTAALIACGGETPPPAPPPPPPPVEAPVAAAPTDTAPPAPPPKPALADLIKVTMKTMREGFNGHDPAKMATVVTDDVADFDYGAGEVHNKAEFQAGMAQLFSMFSDAKYATNRVWAKGNVIISELTWTGTMTGDVMGMKATNKPVGQIRLHVYWFNDDGLIKEVHEYADDAGLMAQMQGKKNAPSVPVLPTNPPDVHVAAGTPEEDKLADWVKSTDDGFNKDDVKAVAAELTDDVDYWVSFSGMPAIKGKKDLTKELGGFFKSFPDQKWTATNAWGIDGFGIVEHTMTGTFKGPFGALRPTGKQVTGWHNIDIIQPTSDGKIQHGWGYGNAMEMMSQAGALPKPSGKAAPAAAKGQAKGGK